MKTMIKTKPLAVTACGILALTCLNIHAQLISSESFSGYTVGTQVTSDTPSPTVAGYTGNWTAVDFGTVHPTTTAGSLAYGGAGYAASTGNNIAVPTYSGAIAAGNSGRMYRLLDSTTAVTSSTVGTLYLSFLYQSGQQGGATVYQMLSLSHTDTSDPNTAFTAGLTTNGGQTGNQYNFGVNNANYTSTGVAANTGVHLFVAEFNLSATAGGDSVTVWLDPTLGTGDPTGGITVSGQDITFDRLAISDYASTGSIGNSGAWDNIRFGTTFDAVTVPEPSTLALAGLGGLALLFRRKQGRA